MQTILPAILSGLADESEGVRNAALAAGRTFVEFYAQSSLPLLLPTVEAGIVNDNWRIRQSSIDLLGDLLFKVIAILVLFSSLHFSFHTSFIHLTHPYNLPPETVHPFPFH